MTGRPGETDLAARLRSAGCVFAEEEARLLLAATRDDAELERLVAQRAAGEPLETVLGWAEFAGRRLVVAAGVFVPRRRTELLARETARRSRPGEVVVDLCCGVGAVAAVVLADHEAEVHAVDIDPAAVRCARRNAPGATVHQGDLFAALPPRLRGAVNVIAANAPYVPTAELPLMPLEARRHEPRRALDGGPDGVGLHRRITAGVRQWLAPGGRLLIETSRRQEPLTVAAVRAAGLRAETLTDDDLAATAVVGTAGS